VTNKYFYSQTAFQVWCNSGSY